MLEDGGVTLLRNFFVFLPVYTASHFRRQYFSVSVSSWMHETAFRSHTQLSPHFKSNIQMWNLK